MKKSKSTTTKQTTKNAAREYRNQATTEERFASVFKRAAQLAEDHITERALNIHELIDSTGAQFGELVKSIDPRLIKKGAEIGRLMAALPASQRYLADEYTTFVCEESDAERQAAYLVGVCVGMRLSGGAR